MPRLEQIFLLYIKGEIIEIMLIDSDKSSFKFNEDPFIQIWEIKSITP